MKTILTALIALPLTLAAVGCEQDVIDLDTLDAATEQALIERYDAEMDDDDDDDDDDLDLVDVDRPTHEPGDDDGHVDDLAADLPHGDPLPGPAFKIEDAVAHGEPNQGFVIPPMSDDEDLDFVAEDAGCAIPLPSNNNFK